MIEVRLIGGLGNQMFQYAAGRALALRHGCELRLDTSGFSGYSLHQGFELTAVFGVNFTQTNRQMHYSRLGWQGQRITRRLLKWCPIFQLGHLSVVNEPHFHYWPGWKTLLSPAYLSGYWQSEHYFKDFSYQIRADFNFIKPLDSLSAVIAEEIQAGVSVSLHVRRGDYASNPKTNAAHGLCEPTYYANALDYMASRIGSVRIFVFSDDIEWAKANLLFGAHSYTFVSHNQGLDSWRDMFLMSLCNHHVIANSSFSWWGAWLNPSKEKIVVAPQRWFVKVIDTRDLIPRKWIRL